MALFKILRGDSSRIDMGTTPFHDGYAYFTPDDGGLYIDAEVNGEQKRIRVGSDGSGVKGKAYFGTLLASGWSSGEQTLLFEAVTADSNGIMGVDQTISDTQMESAKGAELYVCGQGAGTVRVAAFGDIPTRDIPVVLILIG